jgi:hypothetical protein
MNRLQKFVEQGAYGEKPGRAAYTFGPGNLPEPGKNLEWKPVTSFSVADEPIKDPGLKDVFKSAISNGYAVVSRGTSGDERG